MTTQKTPQNIKILITEDDDGHAELIRDLLLEVGLANPVIRFRDGQELIDYLNGKDPKHAFKATDGHLLLLDIRMPRMDGMDVLKALKGNPLWKKIPIIMLTTTDDPVEIRQCYDAGCNFYITKPIDFDRFTAVLRSIGLFLMIVQVPKHHS